MQKETKQQRSVYIMLYKQCGERESFLICIFKLKEQLDSLQPIYLYSSNLPKNTIFLFFKVNKSSNLIFCKIMLKAYYHSMYPFYLSHIVSYIFLYQNLFTKS